LVPCPEIGRPLGSGEIRVRVLAAGLNFRDVLTALDVDPSPQGGALGGEATAVVTEIGPDVTGLRPGDRVFGLVPGAFGPIAITDQRLVTAVPDGWSDTVAASVPVVFLTAYYGLVDLGQLRPGQTVLVHAGAGGVGMAAIQLARHLGAEVYATAHESKWDVLRSLGLDDDHIASSRSLEFASRFRDIDVVLNSLAREYVDASAGVLAPGGRFVEMGKADIRDAADFPHIRYQAFDLFDAGVDRIGQMLALLLEMFDGGALRPSRVSTWDIRRAPDAFRFMSQAKHIGKLVLTMPPALDPDGTVLITGGTGGLGRSVARHLVAEYGLRHLVLASRSGETANGAKELAAELGVDVSIVACDVADRSALAELIAGIPAEHPLTGVVHTAGVLDDGVIGSLTPQRLHDVLAPKVDAAWHLHELTEKLALFVVFSSLSGTIGSPGQGNYAAGNLFLDALVQHRRQLGLPATSMAWGPWTTDTGLTGQMSEVDLRRMVRAGLPAMSARQGLALFDRALRTDEPVLGLTRINVSTLRSHGTVPPLMRVLAGGGARQVVGERPSSSTGLAGLSGPEREQALLDLVRDAAAAVLGHSSGWQIPTDQPLRDMGFDSLTAVELRNRLGSLTGLTLSATMVFDHPDLLGLVRHLAENLGTATPADQGRVGMGDQDAIGDLFVDAVNRRQVPEIQRFLLEGVSMRPKFGPGEQPARPPVRLSSGDDGPHLVCICPPVVALGGPYVYMRFAAEFGGRRRVSAIMPPGFTAGEKLPATREAMIAAMADAVREHVGDGSYALVGTSSAGVLAYEIGRELERRDAAPTGVVLLDSYRLNDEVMGRWLNDLPAAMLEKRHLSDGIGFDKLTAGTWVCGQLFLDWRPAGLAAPTLLVRASEPVVAEPDGLRWQSDLDGMSAVVDVAGNHFTILESEHVAATATVVDSWLTELS
jgi:NADPH:quinone reductase-like Zn-dependent oxidoreductase/thioesterase domain-containing protein